MSNVKKFPTENKNKESFKPSDDFKYDVWTSEGIDLLTNLVISISPHYIGTPSVFNDEPMGHQEIAENAFDLAEIIIKIREGYL